MSERINIYQDVPDHQEGQTSSIGGLWPPSEASFARVKAIDTRKAHESLQSVATLVREFEGVALETFEAKGGTTRVQFRSVVEGGVLSELSAHKNAGGYVEATIPLEPGVFGMENPTLVYFGINSVLRTPNIKDLTQIYANINSMLNVRQRNLVEIFSKPHINGYQIDILNDRGASEQKQLAVLYKRFGWDEDEVAELMQNNDNIFSVARMGDQIVSAGIAEIAQIPIGTNILRMAEITEAATLDDHGGQGLYTAVSASLLVELASMSLNCDLGGPVDLVFGECNGLSAGVLKVAKIQGRMFATETGNQFGFSNSGILKQQVPIGGVERSTKYNIPSDYPRVINPGL